MRQELSRAESATIRESSPDDPRASGQLDSAGKVALFRSLFRGREDVFPKLWVNPKTAKKGYAPA